MIYLIHGNLQEGYHIPMSPLAVASWVGLFLTGLNMMPISQLDGGHVIYALLGKRSYIVARGCLLAGVAYVVFSGETAWVLILLLLFLMGPTHPPTADDDVPLGRTRYVLGCLSLLLPILCFPPVPFNPLYLQ